MNIGSFRKGHDLKASINRSRNFKSNETLNRSAYDSMYKFSPMYPDMVFYAN